MSATRQPAAITDNCAACNKANTWVVPQQAATILQLRCRFCGVLNHVSNAGGGATVNDR